MASEQDRYFDYRILTMHTCDLGEKELMLFPELYKSCIGEKAASNLFIREIVSGNLEPWVWRNLHSPRREQNSIALAFCDGTLVGYNSYVALPGFYKGKNQTFGFGQDSMVHPEHRRKGLYSAILGKHKDFAKRHTDMGVIYGFPNSINPLSKLEGDRIDPNRVMKEGAYLEQILLHVPFYENIHISKEFKGDFSFIDSRGIKGSSFAGIDGLPEFLGLTAESDKEKGALSIERSIDFIDWRYLNNIVSREDYSFLFFKKEGNITGFAVLKTYHDVITRGHILELIAEDDVAARNLVLASEAYFKNIGAKDCSLTSQVGATHHDFVSSRYSLSERLRFNLIIESLNEEINLYGTDIDNCLIRAGDIDVF